MIRILYGNCSLSGPELEKIKNIVKRHNLSENVIKIIPITRDASFPPKIWSFEDSVVNIQIENDQLMDEIIEEICIEIGRECRKG